jgi:hypothetical protein
MAPRWLPIILAIEIESAGSCLSEIKLAHTDDEVRQEMA